MRYNIIVRETQILLEVIIVDWEVKVGLVLLVISLSGLLITNINWKYVATKLKGRK